MTSAASPWGLHHERLLRKWAETAKTMAVLHTSSSLYYDTLDKRLGVPLVILGAAVSSSIFLSGSHGSEALTLVNGGMSLVVVALTGIGRFLGLSELRVKHAAASNEYTSIAMNVDSVLSFPRMERSAGPEKTLDTTRQKIMDIKVHSPPVATWLFNDYLGKLTKSPLTRIRSQVNESQGGTPVRNVRSGSLPGLFHTAAESSPDAPLDSPPTTKHRQGRSGVQEVVVEMGSPPLSGEPSPESSHEGSPHQLAIEPTIDPTHSPEAAFGPDTVALGEAMCTDSDESVF